MRPRSAIASCIVNALSCIFALMSEPVFTSAVDVMQETARLLAAADTTTAQLSALSGTPLAAGLGGQGSGHGEAALRSTVERQGALISDYRMEVSG